MTAELNYSGDPLSRDAVRCRPADIADIDLVVAPTWQPAYAGPPPVRIRDPRNGNRVTLQRRLIDLAENLLLAAATWLDERGRRTR